MSLGVLENNLIKVSQITFPMKQLLAMIETNQNYTAKSRDKKTYRVFVLNNKNTQIFDKMKYFQIWDGIT